MPSLNTAYQWVVNACNAPNIRYSQDYREGQTVGGYTYYDCSSLLSAGLTAGGFFTSNPWFTTATERSYITQAGWTEVDINGQWLPGDIVWRNGHTEMVYSTGDTPGSGITMGAHSSSLPGDQQVSINSYTSDASNYTSLWRYGDGGGTDLQWIYGNRYLSEAEMQNNAYVQYSDLYFKGWTLNAIAGLLGNEETESTINPGVWQNLEEGNYNLGFGLVQWTPATNYTEWATAQGYDISDGFGQDIWLDTMSASSGQWIPTTEYPLSFEEYKTSTDTPENLASAWLKNFERAGVEVENERREQARKWYDYLDGLSPYPPTPETGKRKSKWIYYTRLYKRR